MPQTLSLQEDPGKRAFFGFLQHENPLLCRRASVEPVFPACYPGKPAMKALGTMAIQPIPCGTFQKMVMPQIRTANPAKEPYNPEVISGCILSTPEIKTLRFPKPIQNTQ